MILVARVLSGSNESAHCIAVDFAGSAPESSAVRRPPSPTCTTHAGRWALVSALVPSRHPQLAHAGACSPLANVHFDVPSERLHDSTFPPSQDERRSRRAAYAHHDRRHRRCQRLHRRTAGRTPPAASVGEAHAPQFRAARRPVRARTSATAAHRSRVLPADGRQGRRHRVRLHAAWAGGQRGQTAARRGRAGHRPECRLSPRRSSCTRSGTRHIRTRSSLPACTG